MIAYPPWKSDFLRLILQTKKTELSVFAYNISIQVWSWSAAHSRAILFAINITNIIQPQNVLKIRLICHLKRFLGLQRKTRFINPPPWLIAHLLRVSCNLSSYTKAAAFFLQKTFIESCSSDHGWHRSVKMIRN